MEDDGDDSEAEVIHLDDWEHSGNDYKMFKN
jgi:hypothetical protein